MVTVINRVTHAEIRLRGGGIRDPLILWIDFFKLAFFSTLQSKLRIAIILGTYNSRLKKAIKNNRFIKFF